MCIRWYLRYSLSYRDLEEIMLERGLHVDHTTIYRWVQRYAQELEKRCRPHLKATNDSWRVDETYIKVKKTWMYLYRAVDSEGNTLEFLLSPTRDAEAAKRFFFKTLGCSHTVTPRVLTVEKNAAYPKALGELKAGGSSRKAVNGRPRQVPQEYHRTRSSFHQTSGQTGTGLLFGGDRVANLILFPSESDMLFCYATA